MIDNTIEGTIQITPMILVERLSRKNVSTD